MPQGITTAKTASTVDQVVERLETALATRGIKLFAVIDHSGEAAAAGLQMPPTRLLLFGNPKAGTPVMLAAPSAALDLPLKILVAQDADGQTWISWNDPAYLQQRHGFPVELTANLAAAALLVANLVA